MCVIQLGSISLLVGAWLSNQAAFCVKHNQQTHTLNNNKNTNKNNKTERKDKLRILKGDSCIITQNLCEFVYVSCLLGLDLDPTCQPKIKHT